MLYGVQKLVKGGLDRMPQQSTAPAKRGRRGPQRALSEEQIVDAALALLEEGGTAAMSVRGIAGRVGVAPNAVYTYFPDKAAVERGVVERLLGEVRAAAPPREGESWRDGIEALAVALHDVLARHPGAVPLTIGGPIDGPHALALGERLLELLDAAGLSPQDAARSSYLLITYAFGSMALDVADPSAGGPGPLPPEQERVAARREAFAQTPADVYPRSAAVTDVMAAYVSREQYLFGLHRILDGIAATAPSRRARRR
jgi:AcrR family transcriptional regulator